VVKCGGGGGKPLSFLQDGSRLLSWKFLSSDVRRVEVSLGGGTSAHLERVSPGHKRAVMRFTGE